MKFFKSNQLRFILYILLPLIIIDIFAIILNILWFEIIDSILLISGIIGFIRSYIPHKEWTISNAKIVYTRWFPFGSYVAIQLFGVIFVNKFNLSTNLLPAKIIRHELIHKMQLYETGYILFYFLYVFEFIVWLISYFFRKTSNKWKKAYRAICFEQEAYDFEMLTKYNRSKFYWISSYLKLD